jgi:hypothetical protein
MKVTEDTPVKKIHGADPAEVIDIAITQISQEKRFASGEFGGVGGTHGETSNDSDREEITEV